MKSVSEHFAEKATLIMLIAIDIFWDTIGIILIMVNMRSVDWIQKTLMDGHGVLSMFEGSRFEVTLEYVFRQIDVALIVGLVLISSVNVLKFIWVSNIKRDG